VFSRSPFCFSKVESESDVSQGCNECTVARLKERAQRESPLELEQQHQVPGYFVPCHQLSGSSSDQAMQPAEDYAQR